MADYDFIRLTFDGQSTDTFGLYVVSGSDMYSESITPEFENRTTRIPGRPISLYWGTDLSDKIIEVNLATDQMTDRQYNAFKKHFRPGKVGKLSFEETDFQYYHAILNAVPIINFVPFEETRNNVRQNIYKGDITLSFRALLPYAESDLYLAGEDELACSWYVRSGLPRAVDFPASDGVKYFLAQGKNIYNRAVVDTPQGAGSSIKLYHAGNTDAQIRLSFTKNTSLGSAPHYEIGWADLIVDEIGHLMRPAPFVDVRRTIDLVGTNFANWEQTKTTVLNLLRAELSSELRDPLIAMTNATGAGLAFTTIDALVSRIQAAYFTNNHEYRVDGLTKQCSLTFKNALSAPEASDSTTRADLSCDITGSYNGQYVVAKADGAPTPTLTPQTLSFNQSLSNINVFFKNTYI